MDKRCKIAIFMGLTDPEGPHHKRQSMVLVPLDTPGVKVMRALNLCNVSRRNDVEALVDGTIKQWGGIDAVW